MPRPRGGKYTDHASKPVAFRLPLDVYEAARAQLENRKQWAEWLRNVVRQAVGVPLDYEAGYDEGYRAGWADSKQQFQRGAEASR